jgi:murein DD-endopeptidase MepM/ murein hydrolase activator NlpD
VEREGLERVEPPRSLDDVLAAERRRIRAQTADATKFTNAERIRLTQLAKEKRSWNPLTRVAAGQAEQTLRGARQLRYEKSLAAAIEKFEGRDVPQCAERAATDERRYRQYVTSSLSLEEEMREARAALRGRIPQVDQRLLVLERAGVLQIAVVERQAGLNDIAAAIDRGYRAVPDATRSGIEQSIRREQRAQVRSHEYIPMGGR